MIFRAKEILFEFPRPCLIMGILNVTPDSFSDGGKFFGTSEAIEQGLKMVAEGADIIDIGGESTRPGAIAVSEEEELRRVLPVIEGLRSRSQCPISIDTQKAGVAKRALEAGASIVNDIAANRPETAMWEVVAAQKAGYIAMHMQGTPQTMQASPSYQDVVGEVKEFLGQKIQQLGAAGVHAEQVMIDIGIGFGKRPEHNLQLLARLKQFTNLNRPIVLGASRKSFMGSVLGLKLEDRLPASIACAVWAVQAGANVIRTHDVAETRSAVRMAEAILAY